MHAQTEDILHVAVIIGVFSNFLGRGEMDQVVHLNVVGRSSGLGVVTFSGFVPVESCPGSLVHVRVGESLELAAGVLLSEGFSGRQDVIGLGAREVVVSVEVSGEVDHEVAASILVSVFNAVVVVPDDTLGGVRADTAVLGIFLVGVTTLDDETSVVLVS